MTNNDVLLQRLCLMLAFQTMIATGKIGERGTAKRIIGLARAMNDFVEMHLDEAFPNAALSDPRQ